MSISTSAMRQSWARHRKCAWYHMIATEFLITPDKIVVSRAQCRQCVTRLVRSVDVLSLQRCIHAEPAIHQAPLHCPELRTLLCMQLGCRTYLIRKMATHSGVGLVICRSPVSRRWLLQSAILLGGIQAPSLLISIGSPTGQTEAAKGLGLIQAFPAGLPAGSG